MKEKDLLPGTIYPALGTLLFFLPERYREKLCCVTPLAEKVTCSCSSPSSNTPTSSSTPPRRRRRRTPLMFCAFQPRQPADEPPYQSGKKDGNGTAHYSKEATIVEDKEAESSRQTEDESESESRAPLPSCQLVAHSVQETSL